MKHLRQEITDILNKYIYDRSVWKTVPENPKIIEDLKINSARVVDIVIDIEEKYNIEIDDDTLERIITLQDIIDVVAAGTAK
ncbi:MAG: acyl carrier protein [Bacteroidetes bacterium]|nr:acyl carrier protein [Bacteroidota bacterium]